MGIPTQKYRFELCSSASPTASVPISRFFGHYNEGMAPTECGKAIKGGCAMKDTKRSAKSAAGKDKKFEGFTDEERAAMKERAQELKVAARESDVLDKIAEMPEPDRIMAERLHAVIKTSAPDLSPKLWYGMPAYARDGKIVCFFQSADKFKSRYATFGFNDSAKLDDGAMWPTAFALKELTANVETKISALVKKA